MACIELYAAGKNSLSHWKARIWLPVAFKKRHTHQNPLKPNPVSERSAYSVQNYVCFSPLTSELESFGHKSTPSERHGLRPTVQNSSYYENGQGLECRKVNFLEYLRRELLDAIHFPACSSDASAAPQTFTLTPASYSHSTSTSLHSIGFINLFVFYLSPKRILQSTVRPHQSTARPLERAASHIKVTRPPCLFRLPPWENVNRPTTPSHRMWVTSSH